MNLVLLSCRFERVRVQAGHAEIESLLFAFLAVSRRHFFERSVVPLDNVTGLGPLAADFADDTSPSVTGEFWKLRHGSACLDLDFGTHGQFCSVLFDHCSHQAFQLSLSRWLTSASVAAPTSNASTTKTISAVVRSPGNRTTSNTACRRGVSPPEREGLSALRKTRVRSQSDHRLPTAPRCAIDATDFVQKPAVGQYQLVRNLGFFISSENAHNSVLLSLPVRLPTVRTAVENRNPTGCLGFLHDGTAIAE